eukprot:1148390-Pelagomonas_calceolata.AAC.4
MRHFAAAKCIQATRGSAEPDGATDWTVGHRQFPGSVSIRFLPNGTVTEPLRQSDFSNTAFSHSPVYITFRLLLLSKTCRSTLSSGTQRSELIVYSSASHASLLAFSHTRLSCTPRAAFAYTFPPCSPLPRTPTLPQPELRAPARPCQHHVNQTERELQGPWLCLPPAAGLQRAGWKLGLAHEACTGAAAREWAAGVGCGRPAPSATHATSAGLCQKWACAGGAQT